MKLFVDQCVVKPIRNALVDAGFDVVWAGDRYRGEDDDILIGLAFNEGRLLVTTDRDFGDLVVRKKLPTVGIIYARLDRIGGTLDEAGRRIASAIHELGDSCLGHVSTVEGTRVRRRALGAASP